MYRLWHPACFATCYHNESLHISQCVHCIYFNMLQRENVLICALCGEYVLLYTYMNNAHAMFTNVKGECQDFARLEVLFWNFGFCNQGFRLANTRWRYCWLNRKGNRKAFSVYIKGKILFDIRMFCHIKLISKNLENDIFKNYIYVSTIL